MELKKRVKCINTSEVFYSSKEAGERYGIRNYKDINKCCNKKRKSAGRGQNGEALQWEYIELETLEKNQQDGGKKGAELGAELKASDFNLDFTKPKNYKFFQKHVSELSLEELEKLEKRIYERTRNLENQNEEWKKHTRPDLLKEYNTECQKRGYKNF